MNQFQKERIVNHIRYAWPAYVISGLLIAGGLSLVFSIVHKLPEYKTLTIFVSGEVTDAKALKEDLLTRYQDKELKSVSTISANPNRDTFMEDLKSSMDYTELNRKWSRGPTLKLLFQKYIWGNRQKIFFWNLKRKFLE